MKAGATLHIQKINHGQSEIWLAIADEMLTAKRILATNEVINVTRRRCTPEDFKSLYPDQHIAVGHIAMLIASNIEEIAAELQLKPHP